jgi:hypothetical protein
MHLLPSGSSRHPTLYWLAPEAASVEAAPLAPSGPLAAAAGPPIAPLLPAAAPVSVLLLSAFLHATVPHASITTDAAIPTLRNTLFIDLFSRRHDRPPSAPAVTST